ncbi:unnamed protein product [Thelazia callipaeda]|uniref:CAS family C-terminal domain-containing protein n=1 Tax=Thelazia callipaeda TaxID=103827 RepID=A0A158RB65_THECL|nr:unnamed protein product [Thelazia callipaeda]
MEPITNSETQIGSSSNESESSSVVVNTVGIPNEDLGSSSPSSSGIVADLNDSNGESNQRTSATSSLSSCEPFLDSAENSFEGSRLSKLQSQKSRSDEKSSIRGAELCQPGLIPQRNQFGRLREGACLMMPTLEEKIEPINTSVLRNAFKNLTEAKNAINTTQTINDEEKNEIRLFNLSLKSDNHADFTPHLNSIARNSTNDENAKKQIICTKLVENYRNIENGVEKLNKHTAARAWRQPHILQQNILNIKENVAMIVTCMSAFLDAASRIAIEANNRKGEVQVLIINAFSELKQLLTPLKNSSTIITQLKQNLDATGWILAVLSRPQNPYGTAQGSDALDQFLAVIKQLPTDCYKLIQWVLLLVPSSGARFLTTGFKDSDCSSGGIYSRQADGLSLRLSDAPMNDQLAEMNFKRQSAVSNASSTPIPNMNDMQTPTSILASRGSLSPAGTSAKQNRVTFADNISVSHPLSTLTLEGHESTVDQEDYLANRMMRPLTIPQLTPQISADVIRSLPQDDKQLIEFYSPQLDAHTEFLSKAIEEFLTIILTAHKLIYMADTIAECLSSAELSNEVKRSADRLLDVLKTCVQATKHAADEYLSVAAVQSMANCIVTVSRAAYDLKFLIKQCCTNS